MWFLTETVLQNVELTVDYSSVLTNTNTIFKQGNV